MLRLDGGQCRESFGLCACACRCAKGTSARAIVCHMLKLTTLGHAPNRLLSRRPLFHLRRGSGCWCGGGGGAVCAAKLERVSELWCGSERATGSLDISAQSQSRARLLVCVCGVSLRPGDSASADESICRRRRQRQRQHSHTPPALTETTYSQPMCMEHSR